MVQTYKIARPVARSQNPHNNLHSSLFSFYMCDEVESIDSSSQGPVYTVSLERKFGRAGVIPFVRSSEEFYTSLYKGKDKTTGAYVTELSDFGGRVKNFNGENFIQGACRELYEESFGQFDFRSDLASVIRSGYASWSNDNSMIVIFLPVILTPAGFVIDTSKNFTDANIHIEPCRSYRFDPNETAGIRSLSKKEIKNLIESNSSTIPMYIETKRRIQNIVDVLL